MTRILHTADWQIGRQYARFAPEDAAALAQARLSTVARIAQMARDESADMVVVAGDVFDAQTVSERTVRQLFDALTAFTGPWVMLPGNHDAALAESVWHRAQRLNVVAPHVHLALTPQPLLLQAQGIAVLPAPLTQRHTYDDLTAWFDDAVTPAGLLRIGVAHGSVQGLLADEIDSANPIAPQRAARARLDYLALGDWHGLKIVDERCAYSGTPEPDRFKDNGSGQLLRVEIDAPGAVPRLTPVTVAQHVWQQWPVRLDVPSDVDALVLRLQALVPPAVLDLRLSGQIDLEGQQRLNEALAIAQARHRSVQWDGAALQLQPTEADLAALQADGYVGRVVQALRTKQAGTAPDEAAQAREALGILATLLRERQGDAA